MVRLSSPLPLLVISAAPLVLGAPAAESDQLLERRQSSTWLSLHNAVRSHHGAGALTWGTDLEAAARRWAQKCELKHSGGAVGAFGGTC